MNIFVLDTDPAKAAQLHCDTHVVKMILETTQILCTVRHMAGNPVPGGYKPTHQHHPCTKWAAESVENSSWLWVLLFWLHDEYEYRYHKIHASKRIFFPEDITPLGCYPPSTPFVFAGPDQCIRSTIVESYRALYRLKQTTMKRPMRWTKRPRPEWMDAYTCRIHLHPGAWTLSTVPSGPRVPIFHPHFPNFQ